MKSPFLSIASPAPRDAWQEIHKGDSEALPYQHPAWLDCICEAGGYEDISRFYETSEGCKVIMPLVRRRGLPNAFALAASLPSGWGMGGLVATEGVGLKDVHAIFRDLSTLPYLKISMRPNPRHGAWMAPSIPAGVYAIPRRAHVLDISNGFDHVWSKKINKKARNAVRKAERSGVVVECDTTGRLVPVFYELLLRSFDRWALQQHEPRFLAHIRGRLRDPMRKFQIIARRLGEACQIWVAWVNGQPAASILVLQYSNVNDSRGAMDKSLVGATGANEMLQTLAIQNACRAGCRYYHMGETGNSASLAHFKAQFGAEPFVYSEYHIERFPFARMDAALRRVVKKAIGFRDM